MERTKDQVPNRIEFVEGYQSPLLPCRTTPSPQSNEIRDLLSILTFMQLQGTPSQLRKHRERKRNLHRKILQIAKSCGFDVWQGLWTLAALDVESHDPSLARGEPAPAPAFDINPLTLDSAVQGNGALLRPDLTLCPSAVLSGPLRRPDPAVKESISNMAHLLDDSCIMPMRPDFVRKRQRSDLQLGYFSETPHQKRKRLETPIECDSSEPDDNKLWHHDVEDALARRMETQFDESIHSILSFLQPFVAMTATRSAGGESDNTGENSSGRLSSASTCSNCDSDSIRWDHILLAASQQKEWPLSELMDASVVQRAKVRLQNLFSSHDSDELRVLVEKPSGATSLRPW